MPVMAYLRKSKSSKVSSVLLMLMLAGAGMYVLIKIFAGGETLQESFDNAEGWTSNPAVIGQVSSDTEQKQEGAASTKLTTNGVPNIVFTKTFAVAKDFSSAEKIKIAYFLPALGKLTDAATVIEMRLGQDSSNYYAHTYTVSTAGTWQADESAPSTWTAIGTPNWATVTQASFTYSGPVPVSINVDNLRSVTPSGGPAGGGTTTGGNTTTTTKTTPKKTTSTAAQTTADTPTAEVETAETSTDKPELYAGQTNKPTDYTGWLYGAALAGVILLGLGSQLGWEKQLKRQFKFWSKRLKQTKLFR